MGDRGQRVGPLFTHPRGQDARGPSCILCGPCDQGLRTEACDLVWDQMDALCFPQPALPAHDCLF